MLGNVDSLRYFLPELVLTGLIIAIIAADLVTKEHKRGVLSAVMLLGLALALVLTLKTPYSAGTRLFFGMVTLDPFALFFKIIFILAAGLVTIFSVMSREIERQNIGEYLAFISATTLGSTLLASSGHMLMAFLTLELVSIPCYVLAGYIRRSRRSSEASLKYVIYGAASSGLMVYGISLLFGATGSFSFNGIRTGLEANAGNGNEFLVLTSLIFIVAGIGYKIAVFPFHMWSPDIYEGAPTPVTAFLSVGPKAAGFAVLVRFFYTAFSSRTDGGGGTTFIDVSGIDWPLLIAIISAATMTVGNLLAINQANIKRLLAYSSIAHAGYILMGVVALSVLGIQAVLFYFIVYLLMNLGAFLVVISFHNSTGSEDIDDYSGLGWSSKAGSVTALTMTIFLFSLTGIPPFGGFIGKVYLFASVIEEKRFVWLAIVAIVNSVISLYYYAKIVKMMFLRGRLDKELDGIKPHQASFGVLGLLVLLAAAVTISGILWGPLAQWVNSSADLFIH